MPSKRLSKLAASWVSLTDSFVKLGSVLVDTNIRWAWLQFVVLKVKAGCGNAFTSRAHIPGDRHRHISMPVVC